MIRFVLALIGYVATATVITLALGLGYLWHSERINDDKMFRMVAMVQGVDLEQIAAEHAGAEGQVPPEELSVEDIAGRQQVLDRNYEVKLLSLQRGRQEFDFRLQELRTQTERFDRLARDWEAKLKEQEELTTQENVGKVITDLEQVKPATAKDLLMRWIDEDRMQDVILLLGQMSETKKAKILKAFATPAELDKLHEIHRLMIDDNKNKKEIEAAKEELDALTPSNQ
jgi:phage-related baseplate assembly protein